MLCVFLFSYSNTRSTSLLCCALCCHLVKFMLRALFLQYLHTRLVCSFLCSLHFQKILRALHGISRSIHRRSALSSPGSAITFRFSRYGACKEGHRRLYPSEMYNFFAYRDITNATVGLQIRLRLPTIELEDTFSVLPENSN